MRETLAALAVMLSVFVAMGQISPSMTIGEFIGLYAPVTEATAPEELAPAMEMPVKEPVIEEPVAPTSEPIAPIVEGNEVPRQEPIIVIEDPVVPTVTLTIDDPVVPTVELTVDELVVPEVTLTVGEPVVPVAKIYTEADIKAVASTIGIEARGLSPKQKRCVGFCVTNRVDDGFGDSVQSVVNSGTFATTDNYTAEDLALAEEVLYNWSTDGPRDLPRGYYYFNGDGKQNYFRKTLSGPRLAL